MPPPGTFEVKLISFASDPPPSGPGLPILRPLHALPAHGPLEQLKCNCAPGYRSLNIGAQPPTIPSPVGVKSGRLRNKHTGCVVFGPPARWARELAVFIWLSVGCSRSRTWTDETGDLVTMSPSHGRWYDSEKSAVGRTTATASSNPRSSTSRAPGGRCSPPRATRAASSRARARSPLGSRTRGRWTRLMCTCLYRV